MRLEQLRISGLRCLTEVDLALEPGINVFIGDNGAGKTSILEAAFLLSHARSFRSGARDALLQRGATQLSLFAEIRRPGQTGVDRLGLGRTGVRWDARVNGETVTIGRLVETCAVVCFEPGSHALIAGAAEERRRYLDWGVFHVEHEFLALWRRYQRALKQRNSLLRSPSASDALFEPWELELAQAAAAIDVQRKAYVDLLRPHLEAGLEALLPELGRAELRYRRGWPDELALDVHLAAQRGRESARGHTSSGSHRADWMLSFEHAPLREHLSRGQEKLAALACVLAQAALYAEQRGDWPIVCLDDLASELDQTHQAAVVARLAAAHAQVLLTGTELPSALLGIPARMFHVEQGKLSRLL
jgi:DNA replication and repair protein RecF